MATARKYLIPGVVFVTGASVLAIEVLATRILAPYFGTTIYTISSVLSVILAALSAGYYIGGRLADRHPSPIKFFAIILISGLCILFFQLITLIALPLFGYSLSLSAGPLIFSLLLFLLPAFFLGMLSPYAIALQSAAVPAGGIGSTSGTIFFWSTLGSIAGSLLTGFVLIPHIGVNNIAVGNGVLLFGIGFVALLLLHAKKRYLAAALIACVALLISIFAVVRVANDDPHIVYQGDGTYEKILIYDGTYGDHPTRFLVLDKSNAGAMLLDTTDTTDLAYSYTKYYSLYKTFDPDPKNILLIGGGAYSVAKAALTALPDAQVDVAEIEPSLYPLAQKYFNLVPNPRLHNYVEDGRQLLATSDKKYDMIFGDAYHSLYSIPTHLTTQEFFATVKSRLNPNGVFIMNVIGSVAVTQPSFTLSEIKTFQSVFPNSYFYPVGSPTYSGNGTPVQNIIFVGSNGTATFAPTGTVDTATLGLSSYPVLTDDYSPVEYLISKEL